MEQSRLFNIIFYALFSIFFIGIGMQIEKIQHREVKKKEIGTDLVIVSCSLKTLNNNLISLSEKAGERAREMGKKYFEITHAKD